MYECQIGMEAFRQVRNGLCMECECFEAPVVVCQACSLGQEARGVWALCQRHDEMYHCAPNTRWHRRVDYGDHQVYEYALCHQYSPEELYRDYERNMFIGWNPKECRLNLGRKYHALSQELGDNEEPLIVSFVSPTGNGKSSLIRCLLPEQKEMPLSARIGGMVSVSSDIHAYAARCEWYGMAIPIIYFDSEGLRGACAPEQAKTVFRNGTERSYSEVKEEEDTRRKLVGIVYPRLLYMFSDIICYPFIGAPSEVQQYAEDLLVFSRIAAARTVNNPLLPTLIIIFNKRSPQECFLSEKDDPWNFYCIGTATQQWIEAHPRIAKKLRKLFREIHVFYVPNFRDAHAQCILQMKRFKYFILHLLSQNVHWRGCLGLRQSRSVVFPYMWKISNRLFEKTDAEIDLFYLLNVNEQLFVSNTSSLFLTYWQLLNQCKRNERKRNSWYEAYHQFCERIIQVLQLRWLRHAEDCRRSNNVRVYHGMEPSLPREWKEDLHKVAKCVIDDLPCAATKEFMCSRRGKITVKCDQLKRFHGNNVHKSKEVYYEKDSYASWWSKLFGGVHVMKSCAWGGPFVGCVINERMMVSYIEDRFKIPESFQKQSYIRNLTPELRLLADSYHTLSSRVCLVCLCYKPDVTLTCSHSVCDLCFQDFVYESHLCPLCSSRVNRSTRKLPPLSGCRILSLDGGGTRGLITFRILEEVQNRLKMPIAELFDFIIGTSVGGAIALLLAGSYEVGVSLADGADMIRKLSPEVFPPKWHHNLVELSSILWGRPFCRYRETIVKEILEQKMLEKKELLHKPLLGYSNNGPVVVVTMINALTKELAFASNIIVPNQKDPIGNYCSVLDAALATSAAPTYFPPVSFPSRDPHTYFIDGGMGANCPAEEAIRLKSDIWGAERPIDLLVSVGTGTFSQQAPVKQKGNVLEAIGLTVDLLTSSQQGANKAHSQMAALYPHDHAFRFFRLNPSLSKSLPLDAAQDADFGLMEDSAKEWIKHNDALIEQTCGRLIACQLYIEARSTRCGRVFTANVRSRTAQLPPYMWEIHSVILTPLEPPTPLINVGKKEVDQHTYQQFVKFSVEPFRTGVYNLFVFASTRHGEYLISGCPLVIEFDSNRFM